MKLSDKFKIQIIQFWIMSFFLSFVLYIFIYIIFSFFNKKKLYYLKNYFYWKNYFFLYLFLFGTFSFFFSFFKNFNSWKVELQKILKVLKYPRFLIKTPTGVSLVSSDSVLIQSLLMIMFLITIMIILLMWMVC